jgi:hypothetical protein
VPIDAPGIAFQAWILGAFAIRSTMNEHLIRLRAAWNGTFTKDGAPHVARVDLPTSWTGDVPQAPFLLRRRFQAPRIDPEREQIVLRLEGTAGLRRVALNGQDCGVSVDVRHAIEIPIEGLRPAGNELLLEVDPSEWPRAVLTGEQLWGTIALLIRPRPDVEADGGDCSECL